MGKVEILTLIAGVVLSISLALIVVPMFGNTQNVVDKKQVISEFIALKNAIEIIRITEPNTLNPTNTQLKQYLKGIEENSSLNGFKSKYKNYEFTDFAFITDNGKRYSVFAFNITKEDFENLFKNYSNLKKICNGANSDYIDGMNLFGCEINHDDIYLGEAK